MLLFPVLLWQHIQLCLVNKYFVLCVCVQCGLVWCEPAVFFLCKETCLTCMTIPLHYVRKEKCKHCWDLYLHKWFHSTKKNTFPTLILLWQWQYTHLCMVGVYILCTMRHVVVDKMELRITYLYEWLSLYIVQCTVTLFLIGEVFNNTLYAHMFHCVVLILTLPTFAVIWCPPGWCKQVKYVAMKWEALYEFSYIA